MLTYYDRADWMLAQMVTCDLSKQARGLLVLYVARADVETGSSHLSQERAAETLHVSQRTVRTANAELVDKGVIVVRRRRHRSSVVTLVHWTETGRIRDRKDSSQEDVLPVRVRPRPAGSGRQDRKVSVRKTGRLSSARTEPVTEPENRTISTSASTDGWGSSSGSVQRGRLLSGQGGSVQTGKQSSGPVVRAGDSGVLPDGRRWQAIAKANPAAPPFVAVDYEDGTPMGNYDLTTDGRLPAHLWEVGS